LCFFISAPERACTQASRPATRNRVSPDPATSLAAICSRACSANPSSHPAARAVSAATVAGEHGMPDSSASASAVRSLDRNCPAYRQAMIAAIRGPYWTGASALAGTVPLGAVPAAALALDQLMPGHLAPHRLQAGDLAALYPGDRPARQPAPHRPQQPGSCRISRSGRATCASVVPLWPSCPPGLRPLLFRSDRGRGAGLASPSPGGGLEEVRGFCFSRASSSAIRSRASASSARACSSAATAPASSRRSDAISAAST
jgi:hypothetical protein